MNYSRRRVLGFGVGALAGGSVLASTGTRTGLAASVESAEEQVTVTTTGDGVSKLHVSKLDLSLNWKGIGAENSIVNFELFVRINDGGQESVATGEINIGGKETGGGKITNDDDAPTWQNTSWDEGGVSSIDLLPAANDALNVAGNPHDIQFDLVFDHDGTDAQATASTNIEIVVESEVPDSGVSRLSFDDTDTESGTAIDSWGNNDGSLVDVTTGVTGIAGYDSGEAYQFGGHIDLDSFREAFQHTTEFSWGCWLNADNVSGQNAVFGNDFDWNNGENSGWRVAVRDGDIQFDIRNNDSSQTQLNANTSISAGNTYFVVVTYGPSNGARIYVNGSAENSTSNPTTPSYDETNQVSIGGGSSAGDGTTYDTYRGVIDDPRYYSKELAQSEVGDWYNTGSISG